MLAIIKNEGINETIVKLKEGVTFKMVNDIVNNAIINERDYAVILEDSNLIEWYEDIFYDVEY